MNSIKSKEIFKTTFSVSSSEFIGYLKYITNIEDAKIFQRELRNKHPKANHHCIAYRIGIETITEFSSDDGEPSGTAGLPMLNTIKEFELTQVCMVVVRYFGGTKLGKKGLIESYSKSVRLTIETSPISKIEYISQIVIQYPYSASSELKKILHNQPIEVVSEEYGELVEQTLEISKKDYEKLKPILVSSNHLGICLINEKLEIR